MNPLNVDYTQWGVEALTEKLAELEAEITRAESGLQAVQEAASGVAQGQGRFMEGAVRQAQGTLDALRKTKTLVETAKNAKTAVTVAETTAATETAAGSGGIVLRTLNAVGRVGGVFSGTAATVAGTVGVTAVLGILAYLLSGYLGARAADRPVEYGDQGANIQRMLNIPEGQRDGLRKVDQPESIEPVSNREGYAIWLVGAGKEVIVGRKSVIEEQPSSSLIGWGLDPILVKRRNPGFQQIGPFYRTAEEARIAYQRNLQPGSIRRLPLARGMVARFDFDGQEHAINNALRFLR
jgi:hypothetical protein